VQRERRHRRARPRQRVDHGDGLLWSHAGRRRSVWRRSERYARRRGAGALRRKRRRQGRWTLSVEVKNSPRPHPGFIDPRSRAPRIACSTRINCR
jgi:hypothetical protein